MWKTKINEVLAAHAPVRVNGGTASARTQEVTREVIYNFFNTLWSLGYKVQDPKNIGDRHIRAVIRHWWFERKLSPKTVQNNLSRLRVFFGWLGKPGLVCKTPDYLPEVPKEDLIVRAVAVESKAWSSNGVDLVKKLREVLMKDMQLGLMLLMQTAFGLRRKEALMCRPWKAERGNMLHIFSGESKGGRPRAIPIESDFQRAVLAKVRGYVKVTKPLGWEFTRAGKIATMEQNETRYRNAMTRWGFTNRDLGVTGHGLRAQFAENAAILDQLIPETLGGQRINLDAEQVTAVRLQVSEMLGHSRLSVTSSYYGPAPRSVDEADRARLEGLFAQGVVALQKAGYNTPPTGERAIDCMTIVYLLTQQGIEVRPSEAHGLWRKFSERFAVEWIKPERGVLAGVEVAARQAVLDEERRDGDAT